MSKLLKLKKWFTIPEMAAHLSGVFQENFTESDIYHFYLNGDLKLSVNFINSNHYARPGKIVPISEAIKKLYFSEDEDIEDEDIEDEDIEDEVTVDQILAGTPFDLNSTIEIEPIENIDTSKVTTDQAISATPYDENSMIELEPIENIDTIEGVYDLLMVADVERTILNLLMQSITSEEVDKMEYEEFFVTEGNDDVYQVYGEYDFDSLRRKEERQGRKLEWTERYFPEYRLPQGSLLVVRTDEISRFIESLDIESESNKLHAPSVRNDRMSLEITEACDVLKKRGQPSNASNVWAELIKNIERPESCCIGEKSDPNSDGMVIVWSGIQGNIEGLNHGALSKRLQRRKRILKRQ